MDFDLNLTGFSADELLRLLGSGAERGLRPIPMPSPSRPTRRSRSPATCGCSATIACSAATAASPRTWTGCSTAPPIHLVNTDPPYNVQRRTAHEQRHRRRPVARSRAPTHHQALDVARHPEKAKPTTKKLRAKDRPLANDFVSDEEFDRLLHAWFGNMARVLLPGRGFYIWGGYANCRQLPAGAQGHGLYFSPGDHLGQAASGADPQGLHGRPRVVLLRLARRGRPPVLRPQQRHRPVGDQEGQPAEHDPPDREAGRAGRAGHAVLVAARRERPGPVRRQRLDADRRRADRAARPS